MTKVGDVLKDYMRGDRVVTDRFDIDEAWRRIDRLTHGIRARYLRGSTGEHCALYGGRLRDPYVRKAVA